MARTVSIQQIPFSKIKIGNVGGEREGRVVCLIVRFWFFEGGQEQGRVSCNHVEFIFSHSFM